MSYGENPGLSREELQANIPEKLRQILPGNPSPDEYQILAFNPYVMHQRCAESMRVGRILLAADAAHLNNPMFVHNFDNSFQIMISNVIEGEALA